METLEQSKPIHPPLRVYHLVHHFYYSLLIINDCSIIRFKWEVDKFSPDFSITPTEGYISPGMEVYILYTVTYS